MQLNEASKGAASAAHNLAAFSHDYRITENLSLCSSMVMVMVGTDTECREIWGGE